MKIAMITAGGAGMFCGSCMQDNTLVRTLRLQGADAILVPAYTPIRVDEEDVSQHRVFLGGINVYLDSRLPGWRYLPSALTRWLNHPSLIRILSRIGSSTDAARLGALTIDLLNGDHGPQQREIRELADYLTDELRPDLILFSNALLSGIVPMLRKRFRGPVLTLLQGDDIFLEALLPRYRVQAMKLIAENCRGFQGILTHSQYYSDFMSQYLSLPRSQFREIPLTVDAVTSEDPTETASAASDPSGASANLSSASASVTIGYFARICPEKGVLRLLKAAETLLPREPAARIVIGGFLPEQHRSQFLESLQRVQKMTSPDRIIWAGSPATREEKFRLIQSFDLLCVPTQYHEPKGLYVLEAALCGVESVLPRHGAFPERVADLGAGVLYAPDVSDDLENVLLQQCERYRLSQQSLNRPGESGDQDHARNRKLLREKVLAGHSMHTTGPQLMQTLSGFLQSDVAAQPMAVTAHH